MRHRRRLFAMALGLACIGLLTASAASPGTKVASKKKPVVLWALMDVTVPASDESNVPAAEATVKAIDALDNGINGRPLQLHVCDTATNPNSTASCAQQAVAAHAPAVISYAKNAGTYEQILEQAKIPD